MAVQNRVTTMVHAICSVMDGSAAVGMDGKESHAVLPWKLSAVMGKMMMEVCSC